MDWRTRRILDNLWGPTGTILVHILVLIVLVRYMTVRQREVSSEVEVVMRDIETFDKLEDIEQELDELEDIPTVVDAVAPPTVDMDQEPPPVDSISPDAESVDLSSFDVLDAVSPLKFKGLYSNRSASGRAGALKEFGGGMGERTEFAVRKALDWLRDHQYKDGSWGPYYRVSMTGLALLTFFAHGETTSSPEYGVTVRKGLKYLLSRQDKGVFVGGGPGLLGPQLICYEHAIGTYAVSEAYGLTSIPFLKTAMEDAIQVIIDGQHAAGSWDYGYRLDAEAHIDVSLSGWHIQALKAAYAAGAANRGLKTALDASMRGLVAASDMNGTGMFKYGTRLPDPPNRVMTGVAVLCMQLAGHVIDAEARAGIKVLEQLNFSWQKGAADERGLGEWPFYGWYYISQARFHQGGKGWVQWNRQCAPALCAMQNADGSWCPAPDSTEERFGPVYTTALSALMLEVYYRFLPTYKPIEVESVTPVEDPKDEDEIVIKFG